MTDVGISVEDKVKVNDEFYVADRKASLSHVHAATHSPSRKVASCLAYK